MVSPDKTICKQKNYASPEDRYKALISNERRIKSEVIQQIKKQFMRLKKLQADPVTAVFVVKDVKKNRKTKPKFMGSGELFNNLKESKPILSREEMKKGVKVDLIYPSNDDVIQTVTLVTPSKLHIGP